MTKEQWLPIPGFAGYEASSSGRIRPEKPRYKCRGKDGLKPWIVERHGRKSAYVSLHICGVRSKQLVHRLVALAFHGLPPDGQDDCCHKNHDSLDNRADNLKWDTHSNNIQENWDREEAVSREHEGLWQDQRPIFGMPF